MPGTTFHRREQLMTTIQIEITVFTILFMAAFVQSISGFGSALMAMAFLPVLIGIRAAVPLFAICAIPLEIILLIRFRQELSLREIWKVVLASIVGVPFGVILLKLVSERIALAILGLALIGYSIYALMGKRLPRSDHFSVPWLAGFLAGMLGGAYNTAGPPVILYADTQDWPPERFKSNLQGFFLVTSVQILIGHYLAGNYQPDVLRWLPFAIPAILAGLLAGGLLDKRIPPQIFRQIVLVLLIVMGLVNLF
jgi:uncharacterized membrane protein YfcA